MRKRERERKRVRACFIREKGRGKLKIGLVDREERGLHSERKRVSKRKRQREDERENREIIGEERG